MLFFTTSYNLIIPELNSYISAMDGAHLKGFIIGLFTVSAGLSRPFSGKLSDTIGRKKVMAVGILISAATGIFYPLSTLTSVWFFLLLRFLHGFGNGFFATGSTALITDILPDHKRGSGMGLWGTFISLGIGIGNGTGSLIKGEFGYNTLFMVSVGLALISWILLLRVEETLDSSARFRRQMMVIRKDEIVERSVIPVAVVMFLSSNCSGVIFVMTPDIADHLGIENKGWFFIWYVLTTIAMRLFMGKLSDRFGRRETLLVSIFLLAVSMFVIGFAPNILWFTLSALLFGIATGLSSPTIFAWMADLSPEDRRGAGAGTMFIALESGIFFGSVMSNVLYANNPDAISHMFVYGGIMAGLCLIYLIWHLLRRTSVS